MSFLSKLQGSLSVSFILNIPVSGLKDVFRDERFIEMPVALPPTQAAPQIMIGPPRLPIAMFKKTSVIYVPDRYRLEFVGPVNEILELKELIPALFEKHRYSFRDMTRYCELIIQFQPIEVPRVVGPIRSNITVKNIEKFNEVCGYEMKPFSLSLSNLDTPLSDEWFSIRLQPDVNRPHDEILVRIVKRTRKFDEMRTFLNKLESIFGMIKEMFSSA